MSLYYTGCDRAFHDEIAIPAGIYKFGTQQEYDPFENAFAECVRLISAEFFQKFLDKNLFI